MATEPVVAEGPPTHADNSMANRRGPRATRASRLAEHKLVVRAVVESAIAAHKERMRLLAYRLPNCTGCRDVDCDETERAESIGKCRVCDAHECAACMLACFDAIWDPRPQCETCEIDAVGQCDSCNKLQCDGCMVICSKKALKAASEAAVAGERKEPTVSADVPARTPTVVAAAD